MPRSITHSQLVLQFIPKAHRAVREMRRVTPPGGTSRSGDIGYAQRACLLPNDLRYGSHHTRSERQ